MDSDPILDGVKAVTSKWTRQRKAEERSVSHRSRRESMWTGPARTSLKEICYDAMPDIWAKASDGGRLPTHWRQLFYVARPICELHPESDRPLLDSTFKNILESYLDDYRPGWDVLRGARGVFKEPHAAENDNGLALSTMNVRNYLAAAWETPDARVSPISSRYPTSGAENRFAAILICEKEGFDELLTAEQVPARFDLALESTKGISAQAARDLAERLGIRCFTLHDLDKNGFVMAAGFPFATDIGLRLADVEKLGLEGEPQPHRNPDATRANLIRNGATEEEADFIAGGERVELNELTGRDFIDFVEEKLEEQGVEKVIPDTDTLAKAWRRAHDVIRVNKLIYATWPGFKEPADDEEEVGEVPAVPSDLADRIRESLEEDPVQSWDEALWLICGGGPDDEDENEAETE